MPIRRPRGDVKDAMRAERRRWKGGGLVRVWKRGSAGPLRNTAQIGMQLLCRAVATWQALNSNLMCIIPFHPHHKGDAVSQVISSLKV